MDRHPRFGESSPEITTGAQFWRSERQQALIAIHQAMTALSLPVVSRPCHGLASMTRLLLHPLVVLLCSTPVLGGGTRADYERAERLPQVTANKVFRDRVSPNWLAGNEHFWYRVQTGRQEHEFVLVDCKQGLRQAAFDHQRLAEALSAAGVADARPWALPLEQLEFDRAAKTVSFRAGGKHWSCELESYLLSPRAAPTNNAARPQPANRAETPDVETWITFINRTAGAVELFWIPGEGERRSYGKLQAGEEKKQHTFSGHRWLALDAAGKSLGEFAGRVEPATIEIDGKSAAPRRVDREQADRGNSPDRRWRVLFKEHNVVLGDREADKELPLSTDGAADDAYGGRVYWSPDSKKFVVLQTQPAQEHKVHLIEAGPTDQTQPKLHSFEYLKPGDRIAHPRPRLFDVVAQKQIAIDDELFANPWEIRDVRWDADSGRFTFLYNQRGHQVLRIVAVDAATGRASAIVDEQSPTFIDYAGKFFVRYLDLTQEIVWMSERDGWNHLYLYDAQTGRVKNQITLGPWVVRDVDRIDEQARQIWFRAGGVRPEQDPYQTHFCRVSFDGSGLTILTEGDGTHTASFSPDNRYLLDTYSRVDLPPVTELRRVEDGSLICTLEKADWSELLKTSWQAPERFVAKGRDGQTEIHGVIFRPTNFDPQQKYPIIEEIYAGPQSAFVPHSFRPYQKMQSLAELGFVVVKIDGMGTSHRSKAFHDVCWKNLGDAGLPDRITWIEAAAAKYPYLDVSRVGIYGGSAGGQNSTRAVLAHPEFYKVAVSDCGCHDNRMDKIWWNELWMGYPIGQHYQEQSNVTQAHRLQGKLLLIVGELDRNVDPASTLQLAGALVKANKDFELLIMPGAGHGSAETPYGTRRRQDFFVRHLLGVEPRGMP